jgi:RHS repeat-associated protein
VAGRRPRRSGCRLAADTTVTTYNASGKQVKQTTPAPAGQTGYETTTYAYDGDSNPTTTTAPAESSGGASVVTVDSYNPDGTIASETTGYGTSAAATTSYCYDPQGGTTAIVTPDGNASGTAPCETSSPWVVDSSAHPTQASYQTTYTYDSFGEQVSTTTPATTAAANGAITTATYDAAGNKLTSTDPDGITTTWTYEPTGKPATVTYSDSSAHSVSYTYDADGNRTAMADGTGTSAYAYNPYGELSSYTNGAGRTVSYGYDATGDVTGLTYPLPSTATWASSSTVTFAYATLGRLSGVTDFNGNKITITDNADGQPTSDALGSTGDTITTAYDATNAASSISLASASSTLQSFTYSDAPSGDILSETDIPGSAQSPATYTYDGQGRVASMTPGTGTASNYAFDPSSGLTALPTGAAGTYDNAGELTSSTQSGTPTSYAYNSAGERLSVSQGTSTVASATWNGTGRLTSYSDTAADMTPAAYDGDGLRQSTTITPTGGAALTQDYTWDAQGDLPRLLMDGTNAYIYANGTAPAEQVNLASGAITYLVEDSLGSVRGAVSSTGTLVANTGYGAWGIPMAPGGLTTTTPFGYAGGYTDADGLVYLLARYYDPSTGQFISVDSLASSTLQPYAYASGNPVNATDPSGKTTMYEVPLNRKCADHSCAWGRRNCQRPQNWCNANVWMTFTGAAASSVIPELVWVLWINTWYVAGGQYAHMEMGDYWFHFQWGAPTRTNERGVYKCWWLATCHLGPTDSIEVLFGGFAPGRFADDDL